MVIYGLYDGIYAHTGWWLTYPSEKSYSGWWLKTILKNDGVRQWEGWHPFIWNGKSNSMVWNHQPFHVISYDFIWFHTCFGTDFRRFNPCRLLPKHRKTVDPLHRALSREASALASSPLLATFRIGSSLGEVMRWSSLTMVNHGELMVINHGLLWLNYPW